MQSNTDFYMGALTGHGFLSLFDRLYDETADRAVLLKGGAGTGKSTLLKRLAAAAEETGGVERIHCSCDPSSLDAVLFADGKACAVDATAPHTLEPRLPGAVDTLINLGAYWDESVLRHAKPKIIELVKRKRKIYEEIYRCLAAAADACRQRKQISEQFIRYDKMNASVLHLAETVFPPKKDETGGELPRILYAVTPQGYVGFDETVTALAEHVTVLNDDYGIADLYLRKLRASLTESGYRFYSCADVLSDGYDALIVPEAGRAFVASSFLHEFSAKHTETVNMKQFVNASELRSYKARLAFHRKLANEMVRAASEKMREVGELHRILEGIYGAAMDFRAVEKCSDEVLRLFRLS